MNQNRPTGITIAAVYAIIAGMGEVIVGFSGNYLGILSIPLTPAAAYPAAISGVFYILGGLSLFITRKKWGAVLSIIFISAEILGRVYLVAAGLFPINRSNVFDIIVGAAIAVTVIFYIGWKWKSFE